MRSGDQLLDESKRSDDEPVLVGIVQPPKRPPPPPVVLKGGKLPAIKKRRLDGSQPQAAAAAAPTKQAASQPSPSDSGMAIVSSLAKLPSTAGPSRPSPVIAVAGEQPSFGAVVRPTTALPRSKPIVAMPATDESYLSALCNPRHALHTAAAASKLQAFVPYQQPMPLRVPPPVARPIASIFLRDQASDAQTGFRQQRAAERSPSPVLTPETSTSPGTPAHVHSHHEDAEYEKKDQDRAVSEVSLGCSSLPLESSSDEDVIYVERPLPGFKRIYKPQQSITPPQKPSEMATTATKEEKSATYASSAVAVRPPQTDANRPRRRTARYAADIALAEVRASRDKRAAVMAVAASRSSSPPPLPSIEVQHYVRPQDPSIGKLPTEILALLVNDGGALANEAANPPDDVRKAVVPLLRALLDRVGTSLSRLRAWDAGWEEAIVQQRIERAKNRFIRGASVLGLGEAVEWTGSKAYGRPWEEALCLWHIHSVIVLGLPSTKPVWALIDRYTALEPNDILSPGADPATERGAELVRQRWAAKGRLREIALGWLAAAEAYKEPYRFQHAAYLDLLRSHLLVLPPERDRAPPSDGALPQATILGPPPAWPILRSALAAWADEAAALVDELGEMACLKEALNAWS